jgi:YegS/Rv2252/BmrU family lipid kinase
VKIQFIINPCSGRGKGEKLLTLLGEKCAHLGISADFALSSSPGDALKIALRAGERGCEVIAGCGGDGTIHSLLPALVGRPVILGVIPVGTANDLARNWRIPFDLDGALRVVSQGQPKLVDVIQADSGVYIAGAGGIGFDAAVVVEAEKLRRLYPGLLPFSIAILSSFLRYSPPSVSVRTEDWEYRGPAWQILITKIPRYAYIFKITTSLAADDGLMQLCLIPDTPKLRLAGAFPQIPFLGLRKVPGAIFRSASRLEVESSPPVLIHGDGDLMGRTPAGFRVLPRALRVMMPAP